ncbi:hypothetical protein P9847_18450 [Paenibacillus chibensis]|uniref:CobQ/CobB/MinD/ParA nucleotide binding domain-containing protein n=1 Tax=Paenibacillus chibensis TaxID=59846 RepID=A0ABU6PYP7_9BACL|nr:hypothetical protein [Paenibacillus chibensis]
MSDLMSMYQVILAVQEPQYLEPLLHYVHASEYGSRLRVVGFTRQEPFLEYMDGDHRPDLVVGDEELLEPWLRKGEPTCGWRRLDAGEDPSTGIAKYQPLPELIGAMLQACQKRGNRSRAPLARGAGAVTIGFVSAASGSGKTTAAVNVARQLGGLGFSVFYLNLETMNSSAVFPRRNRRETDAQGLPNLLYEMKAAAETKSLEAISMEGYAVSHPSLKCDWFEPVNNRNEIVQLRKPDVLSLIDLISHCGSYDVVIVDTDSEMNERTAAVLEGCVHLVWIMLDDLIHMFKSKELLMELQRGGSEEFAALSGKSRFIVNRFVGEFANALPELIHGIDGFLPYIPSWKQCHNEELLLSSPIFQRDILKLCEELLGEGLQGSRVKAYG